MPSFFDFMKRMAQGKPIYDDQNGQPVQSEGEQPGTLPSSQPEPTAGTSAELTENPIRKGDASTYPVVQVRHTEVRLNGDNMEITCAIANESSQRVMLDKLRAFDTEHRIQDDLRPDEEHEYIVYEGPVFRNQPSRDAFLLYKVADSGDYFEACHDVNYTFRGDTKTYAVDQMHLRTPIRDIYG